MASQPKAEGHKFWSAGTAREQKCFTVQPRRQHGSPEAPEHTPEEPRSTCMHPEGHAVQPSHVGEGSSRQGQRARVWFLSTQQCTGFRGSKGSWPAGWTAGWPTSQTDLPSPGGVAQAGLCSIPNPPPSPNLTQDVRKQAQTTEGPGPWPCADSHHRVLGPKGHQGCAPHQPAVSGQEGHLAAEPRERLPISGYQQKPSTCRPAPCHEPTRTPTACPAEPLTGRGPSTPPPCRTCLRPGSPRSHLGEKRSKA